MKFKPVDWITVDVPWIYGQHGIVIHHDDYALYRRDPVACAAKYANVTEMEYVDWLDSRGVVQCDAITTKGKRCRNAVKPEYPGHTAAEWIRSCAIGGYCKAHGGQD